VPALTDGGKGGAWAGREGKVGRGRNRFQTNWGGAAPLRLSILTSACTHASDNSRPSQLLAGDTGAIGARKRRERNWWSAGRIQPDER